jgi:hypothetical protein
VDQQATRRSGIQSGATIDTSCLKGSQGVTPFLKVTGNIGLGSANMKEAERLIKSRKKEITDAWNNHFGG